MNMYVVSLVNTLVASLSQLEQGALRLSLRGVCRVLGDAMAPVLDATLDVFTVEDVKGDEEDYNDSGHVARGRDGSWRYLT